MIIKILHSIKYVKQYLYLTVLFNYLSVIISAFLQARVAAESAEARATPAWVLSGPQVVS